jgi:hypothetical protein
MPGGQLLAHPHPGQAGRLGVDPQPQQRVVQTGRAKLGALPPGLGDHTDHAALARPRPAADGHPLVHQRGLRDHPARADVAEPVGVGDPHVGEEDLVELGLACDLPQRPHLDARRGHVAHEVRHAAVRGHVGIGAGDQDGPPRLVRDGRPHLLPGHDPVVAVPYGAGAEGGQVGAGTGLAEQLAPDLLPRPQRPQPPRPLLVGAEPQDGRGGHAEADAVALRVVRRRADRGEVGVDLRLQGARRVHSAETDGEVHPGQAGVEAGAQELQALGGPRVVGLQELLDATAQLRGVRRRWL